MKLIEIRPMIWVDDVDATINYYKTMLGLQKVISKINGNGDG